MRYYLGVDLGGTTTKMGLFQTDGTLIEKWEIPTRRRQEVDVVLPDIASALQEKIKERQIGKECVEGVGIGVPAAVDKEGYVKRADNLNWNDKHVRRELEDLTGWKVKVGNDANVAALGEMWKGGGVGYDNLVMITLGTGVGCGIIVNGQILTGAHGGSGELGHMFVEHNETLSCDCGKTGCLEQYASATGIVRLTKRYLEKHEEETVLDIHTVTAKDVFDAVKAGDAVAMKIAEQFGAYLGHALSRVGVILDPEVFVIGGGVSKAGEILLKYIQKYYIEKVFWPSKDTKFTLAKLGNDAGIYGAVKMLL